MERDIEIKRAANNSFMPYYYGDGQERANLCEAFRQGAVWQDRQKAEFQRKKAVVVSKNYSESEFGNAGLDEQFLAMQPTSDEKALMVVHTQVIDDFLKSDSDFTGKNIANRHSDDDKDMEALGAGYNDGMSISLNPQMDGDREKKKLSFA